MTDFEKVTDFSNMYRAFRRAKCGKGYKKSSARFDLAALDGVNALISQLKNKTYRVSGYTEFKVYEPKERIIQTSSFKDKVVQHSLCDNVIMAKLVAAGKLPMEKFEMSYNAWKNHISHGNCYKLGEAVDERINEILRERRTDGQSDT